MKSDNSAVTTKSQGNSLDFYYKVTDFINGLAPQSKLYYTLGAYVKTMYLERKRQWARNYTAKQTHLHKDTISDHNIILEENAILQIERAFKKNNIFSTKYLDVLAVLFGYLKSTSLFTPFTNINLSTINEESKISIANKNNFQKKGISTDILQILSKFTDLTPKITPYQPKCIVSIARKPYKNEILYCNSKPNNHNMNLLFNKTDVAPDLPFGNKMKYKNAEQQLADIKSMTVPQHESNIWRNPLNNQTPWFKKESKKYTEVEALQHKLIYKETYEKAKEGNPKFSFMKDSLEVLKKIMENEKK